MFTTEKDRSWLVAYVGLLSKRSSTESQLCCFDPVFVFSLEQPIIPLLSILTGIQANWFKHAICQDESAACARHFSFRIKWTDAKELKKETRSEFSSQFARKIKQTSGASTGSGCAPRLKQARKQDNKVKICPACTLMQFLAGMNGREKNNTYQYICGDQSVQASSKLGPGYQPD